MRFYPLVMQSLLLERCCFSEYSGHVFMASTHALVKYVLLVQCM